MHDVCMVVNEYDASGWCVLENGDNMDAELKEFLIKLTTKNNCMKIFTFKENLIDNIWVVLKEENFDTSMEYIEIIENFKDEKEKDFEYLFFDTYDLQEIETQLHMMKIDWNIIQ